MFTRGPNNISLTRFVARVSPCMHHFHLSGEFDGHLAGHGTGRSYEYQTVTMLRILIYFIIATTADRNITLIPIHWLAQIAPIRTRISSTADFIENGVATVLLLVAF